MTVITNVNPKPEKQLKKFNLLNRLVYLVFAIFFCYQESGRCQGHNYPKIGEACPPIELNNTEGFTSEHISLEDLKSKHVILDFWAASCGSCISSFPKLDMIQQKFKQSLQIVLIGQENKYGDIKAAYNVYKKKFNLNLASAYDSTLSKQLVPKFIPHLIWIDKKGIIRAITTDVDLNEQNISRFLADEPFVFYDSSYDALVNEWKKKKAKETTSDQSLENGNSHLLMESKLMRFKAGENTTSPDLDEFLQLNKKRYKATGVPLLILYRLAYFGTSSFSQNQTSIWPWAIVECKDSTAFTSFSMKDLYSYYLETEYNVLNKKGLMQTMQSDLKDCFGYNAFIESKKMPFYKLIVYDQAKIKTKLMNPNVKKNTWNVESKVNTIYDTPASVLPFALLSKLLNKNCLIVDSTKITDNVSFAITADITNLDSLKEGLRQVGLDLIPSFSTMQVLRIKDNEF